MTNESVAKMSDTSFTRVTPTGYRSIDNLNERLFGHTEQALDGRHNEPSHSVHRQICRDLESQRSETPIYERNQAIGGSSLPPRKQNSRLLRVTCLCTPMVDSSTVAGSSRWMRSRAHYFDRGGHATTQHARHMRRRRKAARSNVSKALNRKTEEKGTQWMTSMRTIPMRELWTDMK